jgi:hypothetical protein
MKNKLIQLFFGTLLLLPMVTNAAVDYETSRLYLPAVLDSFDGHRLMMFKDTGEAQIKRLHDANYSFARANKSYDTILTNLRKSPNKIKTDLETQLLMAKVLSAQGDNYLDQGKKEKAMANWDEVTERFGRSEDIDMAEVVYQVRPKRSSLHLDMRGETGALLGDASCLNQCVTQSKSDELSCKGASACMSKADTAFNSCTQACK